MGATERRRTLARGNGQHRENKVEKMALDQGRDIMANWRARHDHIDYTTGHCEFLFSDGERCVWVGELLDGVCAEHRYVLKCREQSRQVTARRQRQRQEGAA